MINPKMCSRSVIHQSLAFTPVALAELINGVFDGWYTPLLKTYKNADGEFSLTDNDCSWMVSLQFMGMMTGSIITITSINKTGCCFMIFLFATLTMISWSIVALFKIVFVHFISRFLIGISMGIHALMRPIWVGENTSPHTRPILCSIGNFFLNFGFLLSCTMGTFWSYELSSRIIVGIALLNLASTILSKEPAQRLVARGREIEGENRFLWLRGDNEDTKKELLEMKTKIQEVTDENESSFEFMKTQTFRIVCILTALTFFMGRTPVLQFSSIILKPTERFSTNELSILLFLARWMGCAVSPFFIDRYPRRTLWMVSAILGFSFHSITAVMYYLLEVNIKITANEWIIFGSIVGYMVTNTIFIVPLHSIAIAELLPQKNKVISIFCASSLTMDIVNSILGQTFLRTGSYFGLKTNFIFFACISVVLLLYSYFYVPETKGLSLIEIEKLFEKCEHKRTELQGDPSKTHICLP